MKRLLFISHRVPYPPDKGERVRAFQEILALGEHFSVTVAATSHQRSDVEAATQLEQFCDKVIVMPAGGWTGLVRGAICMLAGRSLTEGYFASARLHDAIAADARRRPFDLVFCYSSSTLMYAPAAPKAALVVDLVDADSAKWSSYARASYPPMRWLYAREAVGVRAIEHQAVENSDAVLLVSRSEAAALGQEGQNIHAVSNGVDTDYFDPAAIQSASAKSGGLVFTGTMDYKPNVEGVCWFIREVWPALKAEFGELSFTIVGRDPARAVIRAARRDGITVTGSVDDVRPYVAQAALAICPLLTARGIQNKILEAMAMQKAVVASPAAVEGLDVEVGKHLLQAGSPDEWRQCIGRLLRDAPARDDMARQARQCVLDRYSWRDCMAPLLAICLDLCQDGAQTRPRGGAHK